MGVKSVEEIPQDIVVIDDELMIHGIVKYWTLVVTWKFGVWFYHRSKAGLIFSVRTV